MKKRILITGSSGYIGSHLTHLLRNDYIVHGLDVDYPQIDPEVFYHCDINRQFDLDEEYDAVIHLAGKVDPHGGEDEAIQYYITNVNGTMNVLNKVRTSHFIYASDGYANHVDSVYGVTKRASEHVVTEFCRKHSKQNYTIFRFYDVTGSVVALQTNRDDVLGNLIHAIDTGSFTIYGKMYDTVDGTYIRDYIHVSEVCESIRDAIEKPSNSIECLSHSVGYTILQIAEKFREINSCNFEIVYDQRRNSDLPVAVLQGVSSYMKNIHDLGSLLKIT